MHILFHEQAVYERSAKNGEKAYVTSEVNIALRFHCSLAEKETRLKIRMRLDFWNFHVTPPTSVPTNVPILKGIASLFPYKLFLTVSLITFSREMRVRKWNFQIFFRYLLSQTSKWEETSFFHNQHPWKIIRDFNYLIWLFLFYW